MKSFVVLVAFSALVAAGPARPKRGLLSGQHDLDGASYHSSVYNYPSYQASAGWESLSLPAQTYSRPLTYSSAPTLSFSSPSTASTYSYAPSSFSSSSGWDYAAAPALSYSAPALSHSLSYSAPSARVVAVNKVVDVPKLVTVPQVIKVQKIVSVPQVVTEKKIISEPSYASSYSNGW